jgi:hypothetical protein
LANLLGLLLTVGRSHFSFVGMTVTLKSDEKGRYALGGFLPRRPDVRVEKNSDGSVTLHPVKRRMSRTEVEAFVSSRAGTWEGPVSGEKLLKLTRGA